MKKLTKKKVKILNTVESYCGASGRCSCRCDYSASESASTYSSTYDDEYSTYFSGGGK